MSALIGHRLLLASASPRRRRLVGRLGVDVSFASADVDEELDSPLASDPIALACSLASAKAVAGRDADPGAIVIGCDTIVVHDDRVLGKPADVDEAWAMLRSLSGRVHGVVTGVATLVPDAEEPTTFGVTTEVRMKALDDDAIRAWMGLGEFMGCAGAYNIEGQVAEVTASECWQNVAGLPLCHLAVALREIGVECMSPVGWCDEALCRICELGPALLP